MEGLVGGGDMGSPPPLCGRSYTLDQKVKGRTCVLSSCPTVLLGIIIETAQSSFSLTPTCSHRFIMEGLVARLLGFGKCLCSEDYDLKNG